MLFPSSENRDTWIGLQLFAKEGFVLVELAYDDLLLFIACVGLMEEEVAEIYYEVEGEDAQYNIFVCITPNHKDVIDHFNHKHNERLHESSEVC